MLESPVLAAHMANALTVFSLVYPTQAPLFHSGPSSLSFLFHTANMDKTTLFCLVINLSCLDPVSNLQQFSLKHIEDY